MIFVDHYMCRPEFQQRTRKEIKYVCKKLGFIPEIIFDIGANVGLYSVYFAVKFPESKIYAFEPVPLNFNFMLKNIKLNNITNIFPYNIGFFDEKIQMKMGIPENRDQKNTGLYSVFHRKSYVTVEMHLLDAWCKENGIMPDFIKMDVEGSEFKILSKGKRVLSQVKALYVEKEQKYEKEATKAFNMLEVDFNPIPYSNDIIWCKK